jgi:DNA-binding MarR family transcriptional regulator
MAQLEKSAVGLPLGEVSQRLMVSNGNVTTVVAGLVGDGLVDKRPAPHDRRVQVISLTAQGRRQFRAMAARHAEWIADLFVELPAGESAHLMKLLGTTKAAIQKSFNRAGGSGEAP